MVWSKAVDFGILRPFCRSRSPRANIWQVVLSPPDVQLQWRPERVAVCRLDMKRESPPAGTYLLSRHRLVPGSWNPGVTLSHPASNKDSIVGSCGFSKVNPWAPNTSNDATDLSSKTCLGSRCSDQDVEQSWVVDYQSSLVFGQSNSGRCVSGITW